MISVTDTLFHLPGWYWYLDGEKDIRELNNRHHAENFLTVFLRIMYKEFRVMGYHEFESKCFSILSPDNEPFIKWFYNRQPIIQVTKNQFRQIILILLFHYNVKKHLKFKWIFYN